MAYDIRPESVKNFITDRGIKLPRFQRKQTWDAKKNFKLCISLFKKFPIGVCIFNVDEGKTGKTTRWLLDGRQRKNALSLLYEDPENVYVWAKKFIGFKPNDQPAELKERFLEAIKEFLEEDDDDVQNQENITNSDEEYSMAFPDEEDDSQEEEDEEEFSEEGLTINDSSMNDMNDSNVYGINLLLELILVTHRKDKKSSGFTRPFDFAKYVNRLPYVEEGGNLSSKKVKQFIMAYKTYCENEELEDKDVDSFIKYINDSFEIKNQETNQQKLNNFIKTNWDDIYHRMELLQRIEELLLNSKIGYIEVTNLTQSESKKIFTLLNSEGAKLNYVEVLSAKAKWNTKLNIENEETQQLISRLYKEQLGTTIEDTVKWDLPAIFLKKLDDKLVFKKFEFNKAKPDEYNKALTMGFRILAGIHCGSVSNDAVEQLSGRNFTDYEATIGNLKRMLDTIGKFDYFKYFKTWKTNLMDLTSDYIAMNFLIMAYKDFVNLDYPMNGAAAKTFQKNCFKLWDRMIFEYVTAAWRGSADNRIKSNVTNYNGNVTAVSQENWDNLLNEIFTESKLNGKDLKTQNDCKPILYHFYSLLQLSAPEGDTLDIDHIIPQEKFKTSNINGKERVVHNILNLGIIPKDDNIKKSNFVLSQIVAQWAKDLISKYEFIDQSDFEKFSNVSNYLDLFEKRKEKFKDAFDIKRTDLLNN